MGKGDISSSELGENHGVIGKVWASFFLFSKVFIFTPRWMEFIQELTYLVI
jgi:hypothetical protein